MCAHTGLVRRQEWWLYWRWAFQWMWQARRSPPCFASARVCAATGGCRPGRPCLFRAWSSRGASDLSGKGSHCLAQCCHPHHLPPTAVSSLKELLCRCSIHRARLETRMPSRRDGGGDSEVRRRSVATVGGGSGEGGSVGVVRSRAVVVAALVRAEQSRKERGRASAVQMRSSGAGVGAGGGGREQARFSSALSVRSVSELGDSTPPLAAG